MAEALTALAGLATIIQMAITAGTRAKSHKHNAQALVRRLKLIPPLIEEVRTSRTPLTEAQLNVFENLEHAMQRAKDLLTKCSENSKLYMILRGDSIVQKFRDVGLDLDRCLSALPLVQLSVSDGTLEKIGEVSVALREARFKVDAVDRNLSLKIAEALKEQRETQRANEELLRSLATQLDITTVQASRAEEKGLLRDRDEARAEKERGEEAYINQIIHLLDTLELADSSAAKESPKSVLAAPPVPPDEFRCPVSLELMADPVILDSGHTFERAYIQKWLDDGHRTCPISRKPLATLKLIPNQTLKGMIITWCEKNHVPLPKVSVLQLEILPPEDPLEGFKGLRFNNDFSGSSAEWEEYEQSERGSKKRRGMSKFEEELSRFKGHQSGLSGLLPRPTNRGSKAEELMRGVQQGQQRLVLYTVATETDESEAMAEGCDISGSSGSGTIGGAGGNAEVLKECGRKGVTGPALLDVSAQGLAPKPNSGQFSDGFSALGDLYNAGSLKLGDPETYSNFDIGDIMCESPLHDNSMLPSAPDVSGADVSTENLLMSEGLLGFGSGGQEDASTSQGGSLEEPKFRLSWAQKSPDRNFLTTEAASGFETRKGYQWGPERASGSRDAWAAYKQSPLSPQGLGGFQEKGKGRSVEEVLSMMEHGSDRFREKRLFQADAHRDSSQGPCYRSNPREHIRPLARASGGKRGGVKGEKARSPVDALGGNDFGGSGGLSLEKRSPRGNSEKGGVIGGVWKVVKDGWGLHNLGGNGNRSPNGGSIEKDLLIGGLEKRGTVRGDSAAGSRGEETRGANGGMIDKGGMNAEGVIKWPAAGGVLNGFEGCKGRSLSKSVDKGSLEGAVVNLEGRQQVPSTLEMRGVAGKGPVSSRRTTPSHQLHFDWEINGLESSPPLEGDTPLEAPKLSPASDGGVGSSRRSSEEKRREGRLESTGGHRRGTSLPQEPAGRSPLLRSPKSPVMCPILDDFVLSPQPQVEVRGPHGSGHLLVSPKTDGQAAGPGALTTDTGRPQEKPAPYLTTTEEVVGLLEALQSDDMSVKRDAAEKLRALGKNSNANRATIAAAGAIPLLLNFIDSPDAKLQEHTITAILNLSINDVNKISLTVAGAIPALVQVLANPWSSSGAKESAAATLFSLSVMDDCKVTIGDAGAIPHLVLLLRNGSARGRKDAVTALFNLSIFSGNKVRIIKAKAVPILIAFVKDTSVREKCVAVLANLSTIKDGRTKIAEAGGIPVLVDQINVGTPRSKENAAATLLQIGINSSRYTTAIVQAGAISPLLALSQNGTPRAKEKAFALIRHFREHRKIEATRANQVDHGFVSVKG